MISPVRVRDCAGAPVWVAGQHCVVTHALLQPCAVAVRVGLAGAVSCLLTGWLQYFSAAVAGWSGAVERWWSPPCSFTSAVATTWTRSVGWVVLHSCMQVGSLIITTHDLGGHMAARRLWAEYFGSADGIVYIVDAADTIRMEEAKAELAQLLECEELQVGGW
jgi:hypothetical protein